MMNAALIQFMPYIGETEKNIRIIDGFLDLCNKAELIVLPELASTGYNFIDYKEAYPHSEPLDTSRYVEFLVNKARQMNTHIVSGILERAGGKLYNSSILVNSNGILSRYRKMHLFMNEKDIFQPGDGELTVVDIGECKIGMAICFDYLFPEIWRMQAMKGADIICHPSNLLTQNAHRCVPGLSLMNRVFILTANRTGQERGLTFNGQSTVTNPAGEVILKGSAEREEVLQVAIQPELARNKMVTPRNHAFDDRRPDLYS